MARHVSLRGRSCLAICFACMMIFLSACGQKVSFDNAYDASVLTANVGSSVLDTSNTMAFFAQDLCVGTSVEGPLTQGLFDLQELTIPVGENIFNKMYPASTTKVMTAYVALKHGDLSKEATVSEKIRELDPHSSVAGLSVGDKLKLEPLLYGLMLNSGNDAAVAIAEAVSGSEEAFIELMNEEARSLGATGTHFVNPHGLPDPEHYTTVYDLYLMFHAALQYDVFRTILSTGTYTAEIQNIGGEFFTKEWKNTNRYLSGEETAPDGITVIGGKTGTTGDAGYCLALLSNSQLGTPFISIVLGADSRYNLYQQMGNLLSEEPKQEANQEINPEANQEEEGQEQ